MRQRLGLDTNVLCLELVHSGMRSMQRSTAFIFYNLLSYYRDVSNHSFDPFILPI